MAAKTSLAVLRRWALGLTGAILVGALGSGLWEVALREPALWLGRSLLELVGFAIRGYVDSTYARVGAGAGDELSVVPFTTLALLAATLPGFMAFMVHKRYQRWTRRSRHMQGDSRALEALTRESQQAEKLVPFLLYRVLVPLAILVPALALTSFTQTLYVRQAAIWSNRSLDIIAPHVTEAERLLLRAQLRSVENEEGFVAFETSVRATASRVGRTLPRFESIRRKARRSNP